MNPLSTSCITIKTFIQSEFSALALEFSTFHKCHNNPVIHLLLSKILHHWDMKMSQEKYAIFFFGGGCGGGWGWGEVKEVYYGIVQVENDISPPAELLVSGLFSYPVYSLPKRWRPAWLTFTCNFVGKSPFKWIFSG